MLQQVSDALKYHLDSLGYQTIFISLSDLLNNVEGWVPEPDPSEYTRIRHRQSWGYKLRKTTGAAGLARAAIVAIRRERFRISGSHDTPASGYAYILRQLKHPAEVVLLREVYGTSFCLIGGHAPREIRVDHLTERMANRNDDSDHTKYKDKAEEIIRIDDKEEIASSESEDANLGQNTRDTYPLADFFVDLQSIDRAKAPIGRLADLLFGHPFHTPYPEEYAMYQASAAALRSSDENRQVGAVIVKLTDKSGTVTNIDVVASGMNEVPRRGGGFYWQDASPDERDQAVKEREGIEPSDRIKTSALTELIERMQKENLLRAEDTRPANQIARSLLQILKGTQFMAIGEFSRPVHAEMAALIDAARRGVAVDRLSLYVTTFPCHNCAKHIIASGIQRVVYLEPYPKSKAKLLYGNEIELEPRGPSYDDRVAFYPFSGVAPRIYRRLFNMSQRGGSKGVSLRLWNENKKSLVPIYSRNSAEAYIPAERRQLHHLPESMYSWDKRTVCP